MTASHRELDLESLEQLTRGTHAMGESIVADCPRVNGSVVLATCNRFEVYLDVDLDVVMPEDASRGVADLVAYITRAVEVDASAAARAFTIRVGNEVVDHLFAVVAGLDSLVIGEREIAGQVRRALREAQEKRTTTGVLERLFQHALRTSKYVASRTQLGADGRSVVSVGLTLAEQWLAAWGTTSALVVGTGAYAGATVAALRARGVRDISVYSGSGRAETFAQSHRLTPVVDLESAVADADIVLCCSGTGGGREVVLGDESGSVSAPVPVRSSVSFVLDSAAVVAARRVREQQAESVQEAVLPQVIVDLALHRDTDPRIADIDSVRLVDLSTIRAHVPVADTQAVAHAVELLGQSVELWGLRELVRSADQFIAPLAVELEEHKVALAQTLRIEGVPEKQIWPRVVRELSAPFHSRVAQFRDLVRNGVSVEEAAIAVGFANVLELAGR